MARSRRKKLIQDNQNHDRWLVSYADFITLLFGFFVVMYSVSSLNEGKYKVLTDTLEQAFSFPNRSLDPIQIGKISRRSEASPVILQQENNPPEINEKLEKVRELERQQQEMSKISKQIEEMLSPYIDQELIETTRDDLWLKIEMKSSLLFASGSAQLAPAAIPVLSKIATVFHNLPNTIHVEGHTDDRPIETPAFPSNWELSAGRAASVVSRLVQEGVNPQRMAAIGYGEYHPVADNRLEEGREKNRRVVLVLLAQSVSRFKLDGSDEDQPILFEVTSPAARKPGVAPEVAR
ncbi:MAG: flagellar motor protein MotD [Gammaproteobacteria bacterium]